jgi:hypothetical protein
MLLQQENKVTAGNIMSSARKLCAVRVMEEGMGAMKVQIAPAMEAEEICSGDQGIGFFVEDHRLNILNSAK